MTSRAFAFAPDSSKLIRGWSERFRKACGGCGRHHGLLGGAPLSQVLLRQPAEAGHRFSRVPNARPCGARQWWPASHPVHLLRTVEVSRLVLGPGISHPSTWRGAEGRRGSSGDGVLRCSGAPGATPGPRQPANRFPCGGGSASLAGENTPPAGRVWCAPRASHSGADSARAASGPDSSPGSSLVQPCSLGHRRRGSDRCARLVHSCPSPTSLSDLGTLPPCSARPGSGLWCVWRPRVLATACSAGSHSPSALGGTPRETEAVESRGTARQGLVLGMWLTGYGS